MAHFNVALIWNTPQMNGAWFIPFVSSRISVIISLMEKEEMMFLVKPTDFNRLSLSYYSSKSGPSSTTTNLCVFQQPFGKWCFPVGWCAKPTHWCEWRAFPARIDYGRSQEITYMASIYSFESKVSLVRQFLSLPKPTTHNSYISA